MSLLGAILAGGRSSRMGRDKANMLVGDLTMLDRVHQALSQVAPSVVVLGRAGEGYECWPDRVAASGPLAGLVTGLERSAADRLLVVAVDHPFVSVETLRRLTGLESDLPVVPVDEEGVRQVTCAVYPRHLAPVAREEAAMAGSIQSLIDRVSFRPVPPSIWRGWGEDGRSWFSVDTPQALEEGLSRFSA